MSVMRIVGLRRSYAARVEQVALGARGHEATLAHGSPHALIGRAAPDLFDGGGVEVAHRELGEEVAGPGLALRDDFHPAVERHTALLTGRGSGTAGQELLELVVRDLRVVPDLDPPVRGVDAPEVGTEILDA